MREIDHSKLDFFNDNSYITQKLISSSQFLFAGDLHRTSCEECPHHRHYHFRLRLSSYHHCISFPLRLPTSFFVFSTLSSPRLRWRHGPPLIGKQGGERQRRQREKKYWHSDATVPGAATTTRSVTAFGFASASFNPTAARRVEAIMGQFGPYVDPGPYVAPRLWSTTQSFYGELGVPWGPQAGQSPI